MKPEGPTPTDKERGLNPSKAGNKENYLKDCEKEERGNLEIITHITGYHGI